MTTKPVHFLIVEDDDDHAELIGMELEASTLEGTCKRVPDGETAVAYLRGEGEHAGRPRPDVVLLDLKLPRLDGHQVLEVIKQDEDLRSIPVVMLTTSAADADRARAYDNYVNSYLVKPVDFEKFQQLIRDLGRYWANWNEGPVAGSSPA